MEGTLIVMVIPLLNVRYTVGGLRVAVGPEGAIVAVRVTLPWKPFRLWRLKVCVALLPAGMIREVAGVVRLKSVATMVRRMLCERIPSVAVTTTG